MPNESDDDKTPGVRSAILASLVDETMRGNNAGRAPNKATSRTHDPDATTQPQIVRVADPAAITEDVPKTPRPQT